MGQKVHPIGFRLGFNKTWSSNWFARRDFADLLHEDLLLRTYIKKTLYHAGISKITIERWGAGAFPVVGDLVVDRCAFDRILLGGG